MLGGEEQFSSASDVGDIRVPIVVRDPTHKVARLQPQDANVVDVHIASRGKQADGKYTNCML